MAITFYFDPICPFTWKTSRWLTDAASRNGEPITWKFLSLAVLNEGKDIPEQYRAHHAFGLRAHRVLAAAGRDHGPEAVGALYTALGKRLHEQDGGPDGDTLTSAIADAELPAGLIDAAGDTSLDTVVRADHAEAQARVGTESGSPVTAFDDGPAFFGPVVTPAPEGADADRLLEALRLLSTVPQFSELKRGRNAS